MGTKELIHAGRGGSRCLILGGGEIKDYTAVTAQIKRNDYVICADSGFLHCERLGIKPNLLIGDFDSVGDVPRNVELASYSAEKNYTDSTLAVKTAVKRGYRELLLAGMLGGRLDHSLANLQNLLWCENSGIGASMTDGETDIFIAKDGGYILPVRENFYFSLISLVERCGGVTIEGAKYPLDDYPLSNDSPRAVSNEFAGKDVKITVRNGAVAVIVLPR